MPNFKSARPFVLSVLTGVLLILIFPGFDLEPLAWIALVPLFFAIEDQPLPRAALCGLLAGVVFYFGGLSWVTNTLVDYGHQPPALSWLVLGILVLYLSFYVSLFCYLVKRFSRGNPLFFFLLAPPLWTALEYLRSTHPEYGFSWLGLGYSQYATLPVIQVAEWTGVYGISALIVLVNAAVHYLANAWYFRGRDANVPLDPTPPPAGAEAGVTSPLQRGPGGFMLFAGAASWPGRVAGATVFMVCACLGYGYFVLSIGPAGEAPDPTGLTRMANERTAGQSEPGHSAPGRSPSGRPVKIALLQGNIEQGRKWDPAHSGKVWQTYRRLTLEAAKSSPDLIVWPEAATPFFFANNREGNGAARDLARTAGTALLFGSPYQEDGPNGPLLYNSAFLVSAAGETLGRYDKIHLVPFGEFVPFRRLLWFVEKLVEMVGDFGRGVKSEVFQARGGRFAVSICYEIAFPDLVRRPVKDGAEFLVNITNDAWFGRSAASRQHMGMGALRAVENRVPIARAANTGISGMIDPMGRIRQATPLFVEDLVLTEIFPSRRGPTYYSLYGDVFSYACIAACLILPFLAPRGLREDGTED
ncbi:MAG: apolipoprotein N-acyltransferase [Nitrospinae bacterium]|nr:apolipoprotein N-acyltransferase [Nitrospinota bacterium]